MTTHASEQRESPAETPLEWRRLRHNEPEPRFGSVVVARNCSPWSHEAGTPIGTFWVRPNDAAKHTWPQVIAALESRKALIIEPTALPIDERQVHA